MINSLRRRFPPIEMIREFRRSFGFARCSAVCVMGSVVVISSGAWTASHDDDRIIVGPVTAHQFQLSTPDDAGVDVDSTTINFHQALEDLGPDAALWYQHVMTLSNPFFEGRQPGLHGNMVAADYIEFYFKMYGLEPAFPAEDADVPGGGIESEWTSYRQYFDPRNREEMRTQNVGGVLRGRGALADEWVVIGGHYDHTGYARPNRNGASAINTGADDNASGTSGMLVLAKRLSERYTEATDAENLRSILFLGFSAEEMGLLGSRYYVQHSTLSADKISIMLNLDMIGRLRGDSLMVQGVGTADNLLEIVRPRLLESGLTIFADPGGQGPSDHASFFSGGIPVLFFFTGVHGVYHRPGDQGPTVNPLGARKVIDLVESIAVDMVSRPAHLKFSSPERSRAGNRGGAPDAANRASLGLMPDFQAEVPAGIVVDSVFDGSAAAKAGIQKGDVIMSWNGDPIAAARDMFTKLRESKPGEKIRLTIKRGNDLKELELTLDSR